MNEIYFNLYQPVKKKRKTGLWIYVSIALVLVILNVLAWVSTSFCDWHTKYIFPIWLNSYGRFTSLFSISVGEILLIIGVLLVLGLIISGVVSLFLKRLTKELIIYSKCFAWILLAVCFIMTQNCAILYHNTTFVNKYLNVPQREYTIEELTILRNFLVDKCNELALEMQRDENQDIVYSQDIEALAITEMVRLGNTYPELLGFYVEPKTFAFSKFFSQQYIMGYYFPFSLEANYNKIMYIANYPSTVCHELSHIKGFMREYDANFISYLACTDSEDKFFNYCGYLSVLNYVDNDFYKALNRDKELYFSYTNISELVDHDNIFLTQKAWDEVEDAAVISTKTVKQVSDDLMEASLKMNGVSQGKISYSQVVGLLLKYYDGVLY